MNIYQVAKGVALSLLVLLCSTVTSSTEQDPAILWPRDLAVAGVTHSSTQKHVHKVLGAPITVDDNNHFWEYEGALAIFDERGKLGLLHLRSPKWKTLRGLRVGQAKDQAVSLYGKPDLGYPEDADGSLHWYVRRDPHQKLGISVTIKGGLVTEIILGEINGC